jgi:hypothetical protein
MKKLNLTPLLLLFFSTTALSDGIKTCNPNAATLQFFRSEWVKEWQTKPGDCQNVLHNVLIREHKKNRSLKFKNNQ